MVKKSKRFFIILSSILLLCLVIAMIISVVGSPAHTSVTFGHGGDQIWVDTPSGEATATLDSVLEILVTQKNMYVTAVPATVAPPATDLSGKDCTSEANRCSMTNSGKTLADGTCGATKPLDSACSVALVGETLTSGDKRICPNNGLGQVSYSVGSANYDMTVNSFVSGFKAGGSLFINVAKDNPIVWVKDYGYIVLHCRFGCVSDYSSPRRVTVTCG